MTGELTKRRSFHFGLSGRGIQLLVSLALLFAAFATAAPGASAGPADAGVWGAPINWPHVPVSAANLPDGRILTWSSNERNDFPQGIVDFTYTAVWNPTTGQFQEISRNGHDMFCGHIVMLEDGRVIVNGGNDASFGKPQVSIFDFRNDTWNFTYSLNSPRWYPTTVAMPDGTVFTALGEGGGSYPEVWTENSGWQTKSGINFNSAVLSYTGNYERNWWPLLHLAPNGQVFLSGPTPKMAYLNPAGAGSMQIVGPLVDTWYHKHGTTVMYNQGKLLTAGGAIAGGNLASTNRAMVIDINGTTPVVRQVQSMANARKFHNGVMLPNGEVLVVGGNTSGEKFSDNGTIYATEIWNPNTETWRTGASMTVPRNYHSIALLLTDGRVLSGGGGLCNCAADHQNAQIYSPPYLFNPDGSLKARPTITTAPGAISTSQIFRVEGSAGVARFTMIKMSSTTHAVNSDLRFLDLPFTQVSAGVYDLTANNNINVLSPGYWMLFALDGNGTPSVAKVVQVSTDSLPQIEDPGTQSSILGQPVSLQINASDPGQDPLTYGATGLPPGLGINPNTGLISGTPTQVGQYGVTVSVANNAGTSTLAIAWYINQQGQGALTEVFPDFTDMSRIHVNGAAQGDNGELHVMPNMEMQSGTAFYNQGVAWTPDSSFSTRFQFTFYGGAPDREKGDGMTFMIQGNDLNALGTLGSGLGYLGIANSVAVELDTWDGNGQNDPSGNHIAIMSSGLVDNHLASFTPNFSFKDGNTHTVWIDYDGLTNKLEVYLDEMATTNKPATPVLTYTVDLHALVGDTAYFGFGSGTGYFYNVHAVNNWLLTVPGAGNPNNNPPVAANPGDRSSEINVALNLQISATDADNDPLTYAATGLPSGLTINDQTGLISGTPDALQSTSVTVSVFDGQGGTDQVTFNWEVTNTPSGNTPPVITNPGGQNTIVGTPVSLQIVATDANPGDTLTYAANGLPPGLQIAPATGLISGTPTTTGSNVVTVSVSDGTDSPSITFFWGINNPNTGGDTTITYANFNDMSKLAVNGVATSAAGKLQVTPGVQMNSGTVFYNQEIAWTADSSFSTKFEFAISGHDPQYPGGDGMTFIVQGNGPAALGTLGSGLGYATIAKSVAVEIDTWGGNDQNDPSDNHIAILSNGAVNNHLAAYSPAAAFVDGGPHTMWIDYDGASNQMKVYLAKGAGAAKPAAAALTLAIDVSAIVGPSAWFGFGAGTGFFYDVHAVNNWTLTIPGQGGANNPPTVTNPGNQLTQLNDAVNLQIVASDPDQGNTLTYVATGLPAGVTIGNTTGTILGNPTAVGTTAVTVTVSDGNGGNTPVNFNWTVEDNSTPGNNPPNVSNPGAQTNVVGEAVSLQIFASDPDTDPITYSATGLPAGLTINANTGLITGQATTANVYTTTVKATDSKLAVGSETFTWTIGNPAAVTIAKIVSPPKAVNTAINYTATATGQGALSYKWVFGDGTPETAPSPNATVTHTYTVPGRYVATVTVTDSLNQTASRTFAQAIHDPIAAGTASASASILYNDVAGTDTVWTVNPDNDTVTAFNAVTGAKLAELAVGDQPVALARIAADRIWVTNKKSASISIINSANQTVIGTIALPRASAPYGIVASPDGARAYVALEALGLVSVRQTTDGAEIASIAVGPRPRHLSINQDGSKVLVSRFITPFLPGENTATPATTVNGQNVGGEVLTINTAALNVGTTIVLQHSTRADSEHTGRGIPNYLGAAAVAPSALAAFVPSKQDNILRGQARDGLQLTHDLTVRAVASKIELGSLTENFLDRVDLDNSSTASAATFDKTGSYLFVALEGNRAIAVVDPYSSDELFRFDVDRAPQGIAVSPDGLTLYVHNFMSRTVSVHDVTNLINEDAVSVARTATWSTVGAEALSATILKGKQLFYDAKDPRLAMETYMSCASCHNDGEQDGRVWDFTQFGEGLRNTITLEGHGTGMGKLHWSANFDEVHDFEGQIRNFAGGTGLMSNAAFNTGTVSVPLGDPKAGLSADLDALAAYVVSLTDSGTSPFRNGDGSLTAQAVAGKDVFTLEGCASCHSGAVFTDSAAGGAHDIGTLKATSGPLAAVDTPTLAGLWGTAPYLHDGSAATLADAVTAHNGVTLTAQQTAQIAAYLAQIDESEPAPGGTGGTVFDFANFSDVSGLKLNGVAVAQAGVLHVTPDATEMSSGSVYLANGIPLNANTSFSTRFEMSIHGGRPNSPPGDGLAFLVQGVGPAAIGGLGSGLGYSGIAKSVIVEMDTWGGNAQNDPSDNHIAVMQNGVSATHLAAFTPAFLFTDGATHTVWVDYAAATQTLKVYVAAAATTTKPATPVISQAINLFGTVGGTAWFGFSAGTGYFYNAHDIETWTLEITN